MFCKNCGTNVGDALFCFKCGTRTENPEIEQKKDTSIETEIPTEKELSAPEETLVQEQAPDSPINSSKILPLLTKGLIISVIASAFGAILFLTISMISLFGWGSVDYLCRDSYPFTKILTIFSIILMVLGFSVSLLACLWLIIKKQCLNNKLNKKIYKIILILVMSISLAFTFWYLVGFNTNESDYTNGSDYSGSYNSTYDSGISKQSGLSLKVDSIKSSSSGSYTYVNCTITNKSSGYSATRYRFVKVKGQFKDSSGKIVDSDWTYAVDSTWLEPGESKTFQFMVKNTKIKSATLSFVD